MARCSAAGCAVASATSGRCAVRLSPLNYGAAAVNTCASQNVFINSVSAPRRTGWHRHCVHLLAGETIAAPVWFTVIEAITASLGLPDDALELTWRSLSEVGNISSASVLHVLRDTMAKQPPSGSPGVLMAMGPGFCSEVVLLRWH